jgi:RNA 3'-terminal phosphate cyclase-like protein
LIWYLTDYEVSLLRLLEKISNGSVIEISHTGTAILLKPGVLTGGPIIHDCPLSRSVGYFLEPIVALAPFSKKPLMLTLRGITTDEKDLSVDLIRTVTLPHLAMFGVEDGLELKVRIAPGLVVEICLRSEQLDRSRREAHLQEVVERSNSYHLS